MLIIDFQEARKLLSDVKLIGRELFADTAASVAERVRPDPEELAHVDEMAPAAKFEETSTKATVPSTSAVKTSTGSEKSDTGSSSPEVPKSTNPTTSAKEVPEEVTKTSLKSRLQSFTSRVPKKQKQRADIEIEDGKKYLKEHFPKERRDQFVYRLKKVSV